MTRILLTGATGFIGRHCLPVLAGSGYEIHATYSRTPIDTVEGITWHQTDLLQPELPRRLMERVQPTHLLHLAWNVTPGVYWSSSENIRWLQASLEVIRAFAEIGGQRLVVAGTCAEYNWSYGYCREEITPLAPATLYGACKHALHLTLAAYAQQMQMSLAWGRIFLLYGPYEYPSRLVSSAIRSLLQDKPALCTHGRQIRDFLHVADVASALSMVLLSDITGPVNIGSGEAVTIATVVQIIAQHLDRTALVHLGAVAAPVDDPPLLVADVRRLNEIGWKPRFDLQSGLHHTIDWWRDVLKEKER